MKCTWYVEPATKIAEQIKCIRYEKANFYNTDTNVFLQQGSSIAGTTNDSSD